MRCSRCTASTPTTRGTETDHDRDDRREPGHHPEHPYPRHWEADVVASDGGIVHLRPILPSDADALLDFHSKLSDRTRYLRYFGPYPRISARDLERFTVVDHRTRVAFLALLGDEIIAVGRYEGLTPGGSRRAGRRRHRQAGHLRGGGVRRP